MTSISDKSFNVLVGTDWNYMVGSDSKCWFYQHLIRNTILATILTVCFLCKSLCCWGRNIVGKWDQYHGYWCTASLRRHVTGIHHLEYVVWPGPRLHKRHRLISIRIPIIRLRQSHDRLIFMMEIIYMERPSLSRNDPHALVTHGGNFEPPISFE